MILLKTRQKRDLRCIVWEWVLAGGLLVWGVSLALNPGLFKENSFYTNLLNIVPEQWMWSVGSIAVAIVRLSALFLDGQWRYSPHLRAGTSALSSIMWGILFLIAVMQAEFRAPSTVILGMPLILEFCTMWFSAGDAKVNDQSANSKT